MPIGSARQPHRDLPFADAGAAKDVGLSTGRPRVLHLSGENRGECICVSVKHAPSPRRVTPQGLEWQNLSLSEALFDYHLVPSPHRRCRRLLWDRGSPIHGISWRGRPAWSSHPESECGKADILVRESARPPRRRGREATGDGPTAPQSISSATPIAGSGGGACRFVRCGPNVVRRHQARNEGALAITTEAGDRFAGGSAAFVKLDGCQFQRCAATRAIDERERRLMRTLGANLLAAHDPRTRTLARVGWRFMMWRIIRKTHNRQHIVVGNRRLALRLDGTARTSSSRVRRIWLVPVPSGAFQCHCRSPFAEAITKRKDLQDKMTD